MKVTASYENTTRTENVTNADSIVVSSDIDFTTLGKKQVSVTYTENGVSKSTSYEITIGVGNMKVTVTEDSGIKGYKKVTADKADWTGEYLIVREDDSDSTKGYAFNGANASGNFYDVTISSDGYATKTNESDVLTTITVSKHSSGTGYSLKINSSSDLNDGKYFTYSNNSNGFSLGEEKDAVANTFSIDEYENAVIKNGKIALLEWEQTSKQGVTSRQFRYYASSQKPITLYEYDDGITTTEYAVSENLYTAVQEANDALVCGSSSSGSWIDGTYDADTAKGYLEMLDADDLNLLKTAEADKEGNLVEYFLWKYDYLVSTNKINNFLERSVSTSNRTIVNNSDMNGNTAIMAVVIISFVGITAIGGYLFVRKQKQY